MGTLRYVLEYLQIIKIYIIMYNMRRDQIMNWQGKILYYTDVLALTISTYCTSYWQCWLVLDTVVEWHYRHPYHWRGDWEGQRVSGWAPHHTDAPRDSPVIVQRRPWLGRTQGISAPQLEVVCPMGGGGRKSVKMGQYCSSHKRHHFLIILYTECVQCILWCLDLPWDSQ